MDSLDAIKWIRRAQMDIESASREAAIFRPPIEVVCYLCHQTAEKILKAYSIAQTGSRTKSHELEDLLTECTSYSADFDSLRKNCLRLSPYMTVSRYPPDIDTTEYHMKQALQDASQIFDFTKSKLRELGYEYLPELDNRQTPP